MAFPELTAFSRKLARATPNDATEHLVHLECVRELSAYLRSQGALPFVATLNAAAHLIAILAHAPGDERAAKLDLEWMHATACRLVEMAGEALADEAAPDATAEEDEQTTAELEVAEPALPDPADVPMPDFDALETESRDATGSAELDVAEPTDERAADDPFPANRDMVLGELLVELGHVTREQVGTALEMHEAQGMRIGECLLMTGATSPENLLETLKLQERMRGLEAGPPKPAPVDHARAAAQEAAAAMGGGAPPPPPRPVDPSAPKPKNAAMRVTKDIFLGEVLLGADMIDNDQLEQAMHIHHHTGAQVGEALIQIGALSRDDLESGLELQRQLKFIAGLPKNVAGC